MGTLRYMAPEQLGGGDVDERTDIFTFGIVLYEMVTGRRAFDGASDAAIIGSILSTEPPAPSSLDPLTPSALDEMVRGCLAKDPAARWQSMTDVYGPLSAVLWSLRADRHATTATRAAVANTQHIRTYA